MTESKDAPRYSAHPWHGVDAAESVPNRVHVFVETTPFDVMKYEVDKATGLLSLDRPQSASSLPPDAYGFVPRTWCGPRVAGLSTAGTADGDPLDVFLLSERPIQHSRVLVTGRIVGGLPMVDDDEADDKLIAVVTSDPFFNDVHDLSDLPGLVVDRLRHYLEHYKPLTEVTVGPAYDCEHAEKVLRAAMADYEEAYGDR